MTGARPDRHGGGRGEGRAAALEDPGTREVNARHGDDHGVDLGKLRALAKRLKTQQEFARGLRATGDSAARLPAT